MLHSDQSNEALLAAHTAEGQHCASCGAGVGWWQGVIQETKSGTYWICLVCALLKEREVEPPEGYIRAFFHPNTWLRLGLPNIENACKRISHTAGSIHLALAWGLENDWFDHESLRNKQFCFREDLRKDEEKHLFPVILRRPSWWRGTNAPSLPTYLGSTEEEIITGEVRRVSGVNENSNWYREAYPASDDRDPFDGLGYWTDHVPETHPAAIHAETMCFLPLSSLREASMQGDKKIFERPWTKTHYDAVNTSIRTAIGDRCVPDKPGINLSVYQSLGWSL